MSKQQDNFVVDFRKDSSTTYQFVNLSKIELTCITI